MISVRSFIFFGVATLSLLVSSACSFSLFKNFMNGNGQTGVGLGCDNENFMFLQISDFDNDGLIDMYCEDSRIGPNFIRCEWNGSKFSKVD